jgi:probable phosphoglycerate mutase
MTAKPPRGESVEELESRVNDGLQEIIASHTGETIAVVAHMMPLRAIARTALKAEQSLSWTMQFAPASVSIYRFFGAKFAEVFTINSCEHLPTN